jgi:hypothetical protein
VVLWVYWQGSTSRAACPWFRPRWHPRTFVEEHDWHRKPWALTVAMSRPGPVVASLSQGFQPPTTPSKTATLTVMKLLQITSKTSYVQYRYTVAAIVLLFIGCCSNQYLVVWGANINVYMIG